MGLQSFVERDSRPWQQTMKNHGTKMRKSGYMNRKSKKTEAAQIENRNRATENGAREVKMEK